MLGSWKISSVCLNIRNAEVGWERAASDYKAIYQHTRVRNMVRDCFMMDVENEMLQAWGGTGEPLFVIALKGSFPKGKKPCAGRGVGGARQEVPHGVVWRRPFAA